MRTYTKEHPLTVVCFGDSNTRYFLGDTQEDGPEEDSYPARLGRLLEERGIHAQVINAGMPDAQTDYALAQLEPQVLGVGADVCIYGFGTNCVRQPEDDLTGYQDGF